MESSPAALDICDLPKLPKPIELCEQEKFKELFDLYEQLKKRKVKVYGYHPNDYLMKPQKENYKQFAVIVEANEKAKDGRPIDVRQATPMKLMFSSYKPIYYAAAHGDVAAVRTLVEKYHCCPGKQSAAFFSNQYNEIISPLDVACLNGHFDIVQYLIRALTMTKS